MFDLTQWFADTSRLLKIALRTHDPEQVDIIYLRIADKYSAQVAEMAVYQMITYLINTEDWSWFDENGNPSPLMYHNLPDVLEL